MNNTRHSRTRSGRKHREEIEPIHAQSHTAVVTERAAPLRECYELREEGQATGNLIDRSLTSKQMLRSRRQRVEFEEVIVKVIDPITEWKVIGTIKTHRVIGKSDTSLLTPGKPQERLSKINRITSKSKRTQYNIDNEGPQEESIDADLIVDLPE